MVCVCDGRDSLRIFGKTARGFQRIWIFTEKLVRHEYPNSRKNDDVRSRWNYSLCVSLRITSRSFIDYHNFTTCIDNISNIFMTIDNHIYRYKINNTSLIY